MFLYLSLFIQKLLAVQLMSIAAYFYSKTSA